MNVLARISFTLNIPESVVESGAIKRDAFDNEDAYRLAVLDSWEGLLAEEFPHYLDYMTNGEPEVECDG